MRPSIRMLRLQFLAQHRRFKLAVLYVVAWVWRRLMFRTKFVAITGSLGKTTAKECLAAILASRFPIAKTNASKNSLRDLVHTVLRVRPWHRFAVVEVATDSPGWMRRMAPLVRPDVAVILTVARTHTARFRTLEDTATEKARLLTTLLARGVAVLNGDDPRVAAMAAPGKARLTFGTSPSHNLWADRISSNWPGRLTAEVHWGDQSSRVKTRLVGTHWVPAVLGALAGALVCGLGLPEAIEAIQSVEPILGRMQPVVSPAGATVIRDEENGSIDTWEAALRVFENAKVERKMFVASDIADSRERPRRRMARLGQAAARLADAAIFIGERSDRAAKAAVCAGMSSGNVHHFFGCAEAAEFLRTELRASDLVLLKGRATDHLSRVLFAQFGTVACRKTHCQKTILCDECDELGAKPWPPKDVRILSPTQVSAPSCSH